MTDASGLDELLTDHMGAIARHRDAGVVHGVADIPMFTDHEVVRSLLGDPRLEVNFVGMLDLLGIGDGAFHRWMSASPLDNEGEEHRRWRSFMNRTFTPGRVRAVRPFLDAEADRLVAELGRRGEVELMADFADILPALGLCELIGVPADDRDHFTALAHTIGLGFRPLQLAERIEEVDQAVTDLLAYAAALLERRRLDPVDDLVSHLATTHEAAGYEPDDCAAFLAGLVFAGNDTTRNQIGWMVAVLLEHPGLWDAIGSGTVAVDDAVEELLRYRSAVTAVPRRTTEAMQVGAEAVDVGCPVFLSLWGADSDPATYPAAAELDPVANAGIPHLAFGHGPHHCLGAALARAELQASLGALTERLHPPQLRGEISWDVPIGINGPTCVPLQVEARLPT